MIFASPEKQLSRLATIVTPYHQITGRSKLPSGSQFWSLCADCTVPGSELPHLLDLGFLTPEQYVGVDNNEWLIAQNRHKYPAVRFIHDDFYTALARAYSERSFKPTIVNFDSMHFAVEAFRQAGELLRLLSGHDWPIMLSVNAALGNWQRPSVPEPQMFADMLCTVPRVRVALDQGWKLYSDFYDYRNSGAFLMGSFTLYKS